MEHDAILENLHVGTSPTSIEDVDRLKNHGITAVLNLQSDTDFRSYGIDWTALKDHYSARSIVVRRVPIADFDNDHLQCRLPEAVRVLAELWQASHRVFVHCNAGINRSPSAAICFLSWIKGWLLEEAEQHVRRCHRCQPVMDVIREASKDWNENRR